MCRRLCTKTILRRGGTGKTYSATFPFSCPATLCPGVPFVMRGKNRPKGSQPLGTRLLDTVKIIKQRNSTQMPYGNLQCSNKLIIPNNLIQNLSLSLKCFTLFFFLPVLGYLCHGRIWVSDHLCARIQYP